LPRWFRVFSALPAPMAGTPDSSASPALANVSPPASIPPCAPARLAAAAVSLPVTPHTIRTELHSTPFSERRARLAPLGRGRVRSPPPSLVPPPSVAPLPKLPSCSSPRTAPDYRLAFARNAGIGA